LNGVDELRGVLDDTLPTAFTTLASRSSYRLLKVDQDVDRAVELGRHIVTVVIALVMTAVLALRTSVLAIIASTRINLVDGLDVGRQLLDAWEAVQDATRRARSDGDGHVEDLLRDGSVSGTALALASHAYLKDNSRDVVFLDVQSEQRPSTSTAKVGERTASLHGSGGEVVTKVLVNEDE
jgi:hypothetical protein